MKEFKNKVAVVTGAASGIGLGIVEHCVLEGMKVVIADIEQGALDRAEADLKARGALVLAVKTDVSKLENIESLAEKTIHAYGEVHLLFNNAGVNPLNKHTWEYTPADWEWILNVNLWSVIYGVRVFVPLMLKQGTPCYIVNTASMAGLSTGPYSAPYLASKHAVVAVSEALFHEFSLSESKIGISALCPFYVSSRILDSARNRPAELQNAPEDDQLTPEIEERLQKLLSHQSEGLSPALVAEMVFDAVRKEQFYILTHPETIKALVKTRMEAILHEGSPKVRDFLET